MTDSILGTTALDNLPINNGDNVIMQMKEKGGNQIVEDNMRDIRETRNQDMSVASKHQPSAGHMDMNEFVSGIQTASASGQTQLRSRDVPQDESRIQHDVQTNPNFVPTGQVSDYITEHQTSDAIIMEEAKKQRRQDSLQDIYNEISLPIMVSLLYFLYQLPVVRKVFIDNLPFCYANSGNLNLTGYIVNSFLFGTAVYLARKCVDQLST